MRPGIVPGSPSTDDQLGVGAQSRLAGLDLGGKRLEGDGGLSPRVGNGGRLALVGTFSECRNERDLDQERNLELLGQLLTAALTEELIASARRRR